MDKDHLNILLGLPAPLTQEEATNLCNRLEDSLAEYGLKMSWCHVNERPALAFSVGE